MGKITHIYIMNIVLCRELWIIFFFTFHFGLQNNRRHTDPNCVLFNFGHIRRWDQCAVYILYSKISTDSGLLKIRHTHRFVAVVIQILISFWGQYPSSIASWTRP